MSTTIPRQSSPLRVLAFHTLLSLLLLLTITAAAASAEHASVHSTDDGLGQRLLRRAKVEPIQVSYPKKGLLHNYQFLSPGLILPILVMGAFVGPVVLFVVARLSEIGTPDRLGAEPRKTPSSEKKNQ
ncbi:hypothetical protein OC861_004009 [Tilletia horrida]|nr:hypothetical protein OC861_004009 [Tilletia horrida]